MPWILLQCPRAACHVLMPVPTLPHSNICSAHSQVQCDILSWPMPFCFLSLPISDCWVYSQGITRVLWLAIGRHEEDARRCSFVETHCMWLLQGPRAAPCLERMNTGNAHQATAHEWPKQAPGKKSSPKMGGQIVLNEV